MLNEHWPRMETFLHTMVTTFMNLGITLQFVNSQMAP